MQLLQAQRGGRALGRRSGDAMQLQQQRLLLLIAAGGHRRIKGWTPGCLGGWPVLLHVERPLLQLYPLLLLLQLLLLGQP